MHYDAQQTAEALAERICYVHGAWKPPGSKNVSAKLPHPSLSLSLPRCYSHHDRRQGMSRAVPNGCLVSLRLGNVPATKQAGSSAASMTWQTPVLQHPVVDALYVTTL